MKILSRDFSKGEKALIVGLVLVLIALAYYQFVFKPVQSGLQTAQAEKASLEVELTAVNAKVADLTRMQNELDELEASGGVSIMPSYNNSKAELDLLNEVLADTQQYNVSFSNVTRDGDQIRRNFSLSFTVRSYSDMAKVVSALDNSELRCLVDDVRVSAGQNNVSVNCTATFYETMVGGVDDAGLPETTAAAS